ncbi:MAG: class I SAM-dependent methyltransferase [Rhizomicrobium sp.]
MKRVTSDSRPWPSGGALAVCSCCGIVQKPADDKFREEITEIYRTYQIYHQSSGNEQMVFGEAAEPRSLDLLRRAMRHLCVASEGRMLDVGCGNGGLLHSFAQLLPGWRLAGNELSDVHRARVESIPGVEALYVGGIASVPGSFDLITMLHSLEHFINPCAFLPDLASRLNSGGHLLIEVPDFRQNPFDLLIADHVTHFSPGALGRTLTASGCEIEQLTGTWIAKEISALARSGGNRSPVVKGSPEDGDAARGAIALLHAVIDEAQSLARTRQIGLFGTSNAATWLAGELEARDLKVPFFVDEDPARIGRLHMGVPILSPDELPGDALVFVPLAPAVARKLADRLGNERFFLPSALASSTSFSPII